MVFKSLFSSSKGHLEIVNLLLQAGADPNQRNKDEKSPLYLASLKGHTEIVRILLNFGADIHHHTRSGETALFIALEKNVETKLAKS